MTRDEIITWGINFISTITLVLIITFIIAIAITIVTNRLIKKHFNTFRYKKPETFDNLISILHSMIEIEIDLYETNIFKDRDGITNSNFDNYYNDMCDSIISHISDDFMAQLQVYVTEDFIYTLIARKVKIYLVSKIV